MLSLGKPKPKKQTKRAKKRTVPIVRLRKFILARPEILHSFLSYQQVNQYLKYIENRYSSFVQLHTLGHSYEHRDITAIEIDWCCPANIAALEKEHGSTHAFGIRRDHLKNTMRNDERNIVFIEGGTHAREWITISVALNCIYQLTEKCMRNLEVLSKLRFFIVPLVNPDGYEYSRVKNRRWRKNRHPHKSSKFVGTDCNRNYDFHWDKGATRTSAATYKGEKPFSEPETRAMRNVLQKLGKKILFMLSLHSYGQSIMYPWGYTKELPVYYRDLQDLALAGKTAIKTTTGRTYRTGSIANTFRRTIPGSVIDYAYGAIKIPLALVMELPSKELGFQPPASMISPLGHESWFGIREMCRRAHAVKGTLNITNEAERLSEQEKLCQTLKDKSFVAVQKFPTDVQHLEVKAQKIITRTTTQREETVNTNSNANANANPSAATAIATRKAAATKLKPRRATTPPDAAAAAATPATEPDGKLPWPKQIRGLMKNRQHKQAIQPKRSQKQLDKQRNEQQPKKTFVKQHNKHQQQPLQSILTRSTPNKRENLKNLLNQAMLELNRKAFQAEN